MPAGNLPIAKSEEVSQEIVDKKPVKIRIALFFDGTQNNRMNIEEREKADLGLESKAKKEFREDPANSYDNGRTNIAIMEPHVSKKKEDYAGEYHYVYKHYIPGQGPITYEKDSKLGYAFAIGETGVPSRAEEGIRKAVDSIFSAEDINPVDNYIAELTIDVFGFSRGAATARYAIHVIREGRILFIDEDGKAIYEWRPLIDRLRRFYAVTDDAVKVCFAGLYDTVVSYMGTQRLPGKWVSKVLKQDSVVHAEKVLHLAAADEHRADFSLYTIKSAVAKGNGEQYYLPGAHSDVGGSYNKANELAIEKETVESKKIYMRPTHEGRAAKELEKRVRFDWKGNPKDGAMIINRGEPAEIEQDRRDLIAQGWYQPHEIISRPVAFDDWGSPTLCLLEVSRQGISSAYCNIPLKIMAKYARGSDVKLVISDKLERRAAIILQNEPELHRLESTIENYIATNKNSRPEDWISDYAPRNDAFLKSIRNRHFNFSASQLSAGYGPRFEWDPQARKNRRKRDYQDA